MADFQYNFEWDVRKAVANIHKHDVSFETAATVFRDSAAMSLFDQKHSADEDRWITLGLDNRGQLLVVCHTWRETGSGAASCRIISARKAGKKEAAQYRNRKL
ncbi:MAG TPA: BrnT family toxin [Verrucomicrobiae bacterium]